MTADLIYPRFAESGLVEALADTPVVLIHGPRQWGKTTLARMAGQKRGYAYFSFDDDLTLAAATADPVGFIADLPQRAILDEVQRAPGIFSTLKSAVDRRRVPGRFLLTGSANVLLLPTLAESLAGRMGILRLHLLAQCELAGRRPRFLDTLFAGAVKTRKAERLGKALAARVAAGGYPAALARSSARRRGIWYRDYIETLVQRDVRDLARIASLDALPRLLALAAGRTARLIKDGAKVEIVLEHGAGRVTGVEVEASATVTAADFRGLRKLEDAACTRFAAGVVLHDGEMSAGFGDGLYAVPIRALWETTRARNAGGRRWNIHEPVIDEPGMAN